MPKKNLSSSLSIYIIVSSSLLSCSFQKKNLYVQKMILCMLVLLLLPQSRASDDSMECMSWDKVVRIKFLVASLTIAREI